MKRRVILRGDGNSRMGLGHIHRLYSLAEFIREHFEPVFAITQPDPFLKELISDHSLIELNEVEISSNLKEFLGIIKKEDIVVLDGYAFDTKYQSAIRQNGNKLVCIDDIMSTHFVCDLLINHVGGINPTQYSTESYTKLMLGPEYLLVKPFFLEAKRKSMPDFRNLLINFGGSDPNNVTLKVLEECTKQLHADYRYHVVTGPAYQYNEDLGRFIGSNQQWDIQHFHDCEPHQFLEIMKNCAVAILPPSSVCMEYCCVGGFLFLEQIASNQSHVLKYLTDNQLAVDYEKEKRLLCHSWEIEKRFTAVTKRQQEVFDGQSPKRIRQAFSTL